MKGYKEIRTSLRVLPEDLIVKPGARLEAQALEKQFQNFETAFYNLKPDYAFFSSYETDSHFSSTH